MVERNVIAVSQSANTFGLLNPIGRLIEDQEKTTRTTFQHGNLENKFLTLPKFVLED